MRVAPWLMILACIGPGLAGCSSTFKKNNEGSRPGSAPPGGGKPPAVFPTGDPLYDSGNGPKDPLSKVQQPKGAPAKGDLMPRGELGGILAGTIRDSYDRPARDAFIRYVCLEEGSKQEESPIDVAVDGQGQYSIQGLQPHKKYKLIARAKQGEKLIAAVLYTTTPNIHANMWLKEDFAHPGIPDVPPSPAYQPKQEAPKKDTPKDTPQKDTPKKDAPKKDEPKTEEQTRVEPRSPATPPGWSTAINTPAGAPLGAPRPEQPQSSASGNAPAAAPPPPTQMTPTTGWVPGIAESPKDWPPVMELPKPGPVKIQAPTPIPDASGASGAAPPLKTGALQGYLQPRVPSCALVGRHLKSLALYDVAGQVWEYPAQRKGKILLLDFWGTWCPPCRDSLPHLEAIQNRYASLEVVGIAYEHGGSRQDQAMRVNTLCQKQKTTYRQLLGGGAGCPVQSQFDVRAYPTMILLDANGEIIWRHEGRLEGNAREDLELVIQRRLGMR